MSLFQIGKRSFLCGSLLVAMLLASDITHAALRRIIRPGVTPGQGGAVTLPYFVADNQGNQWAVYQPSMIQMQGNMPIYSQAAQIIVNGNQPNLQTNMGRIDDKTGELVLENLQAGTFTVTRRLLFNTDDSYVRVIDIFKNPQGQDQQLNLQLTSNLNYGIMSSTTVADPRNKDQNIAWVAQVGGPGRGAVELYAGKGSKVAPTITAPPGNSFVQAALTTTVPAGKEIAFVHVHAILANQDQGVQWVSKLKEDKLLADVSTELRKEIINFVPRHTLFGDLEILRGDVLDVVELHSGDKFNGNITEPSYKLDTLYGTLDLPLDKVIGIVNVGQFRPRQLIITADGQIFGGHLQKQTIDLQLASGQKTQIPLSQISRVGYRLRGGESSDNSTEPALQPPYVVMSSGDRVAVAMPATPIEVATRYGQLHLSPDAVSSIAFTSDENGVHTILLNDGSKFSGLVLASQLDVTLTSAGTQSASAPVKFPVGALSRLVLKNRPDDKDDSAPTLALKKGDLLVGQLQGELKLDTAFDTITLNATEIRGIAHPQQSAGDISVTTWDGTVLSGQLQQPQIACHLLSGVDVNVPVALLQTYTNTQARAPSIMMERIKAIVADLNADDWKQRDAAEKQLLSIGPGLIGTLKELRDAQTPEARQRIDAVLKELDKQSSAKPPAPSVMPDPANQVQGVDQN